ncbi:MAG: MgtC/SapB family protein [candidate division FCPU426 bacterium]
MLMQSLPWWEMMLRLLLALLLGIAVGLNRERARKPAGVKTLSLVCLGSALVMLVSIDLFFLFHGDQNNIDPGRIAAQVVTGVGFLGAGSIIHAEGGLVSGLTTAASIWAVAGIGLACGAGLYLLAAMATLLAVGSLAVLNWLMPTSEKQGRSAKKNLGRRRTL